MPPEMVERRYIIPNWCSCHIEIDSFHNEALKEEFAEWGKKFSEGDLLNNWSSMPDDINFETQDRFLFNVYSELDDFSHISLKSKWSPPLTTLIKIAKKYQFSFCIDFEEGDCLLYGEGSFRYNDKVYMQRIVPTEEYPDEEDADHLYQDLDDLLEKQEWQSYDY